MIKKDFVIPIFLLLIFSVLSCSQSDATIYGNWKLNKEKSTDLVTWRYRQLEMEIQNKDGKIFMINKWKSRRAGDWVDSLSFQTNGDTCKILVTSPIWQENWYMGVLSKPNTYKTVVARWEEPNRKLVTKTEQIVEISQGENKIMTTRTFYLNGKGDELIVVEKRSSRPTEIKLVFDRVAE